MKKPLISYEEFELVKKHVFADIERRDKGTFKEQNDIDRVAFTLGKMLALISMLHEGALVSSTTWKAKPKNRG